MGYLDEAKAAWAEVDTSINPFGSVATHTIAKGQLAATIAVVELLGRLVDVLERQADVLERQAEEYDIEDIASHDRF